ncbi:hypothetical protein A3B85_01755 [Candidatus Nomurabacteria bacterium RIFCSPHIGHO2_02_FULL_37_13]|uniref:AI-2E family transporter n=1 Tax=Candidatus Nomurabacteria bacterium RIFCSPHIGHO2_02_FULL_37_13 TaxID=1801750 RepID=A0A1F6W5G0_9BACT|nr:MAG: hypothetical protein A2640_01680 [Candidatus Nomurabacteria bacterium RIFCSPHIGHO2_01_FULL_36_23]OGI77150.1 MAG: hypothetical protein A3B85_01755 [Candidatus Nomurabacteria bacterium RIFCSPHIGHO2_02_FULL_37_13]OGI88229.1 MAG: hypothetical protein A2906_01590 [Candidatus Nomurabacteria bacterium RIFCSPLOWO2_01_FULL_37_25]
MQTKIIEKYFFFGLLLTTFVLSFLIFRPFWVVFVFGISFSIVLYPVYEWFHKRKLPSWLSSLLTVFLFTIILCGPLLGIGTLVFNQSKNIYHLFINSENSSPLMDSINNSVNKVLPGEIIFNINQKVADFISYVSDNIANIFSATISAFFSFALMLLIIFYFLKDGQKWKKIIVVLSPLGDKDDEKIIKRFTAAVNGVIMGSLLIAFIQGMLLGFGLWFFNIPNAAVWGLVAAISSLIPTIGTAFVSIPAILFLFSIGETSSAIGLLIWAAVVVGMIDNFLTPYIISERTKVPPVLILFSILGGISFLGPAGVLVGPLTISLLYTLILIYRNDIKETSIL